MDNNNNSISIKEFNLINSDIIKRLHSNETNEDSVTVLNVVDNPEINKNKPWREIIKREIIHREFSDGGSDNIGS